MSAQRLLIADEHHVRRGVRLAVEDELEICAEAADSQEAIIEAERTQPDVCVVGWDIPGDGAKTVRGILGVAPATEVIVIGTLASVDDLLAAVYAGAVGYLPADVSAEQLRRVVRAVAAHEASVPRAMVRDLLLELRGAMARRTAGVTDREAEVLKGIGRGDSTNEIARKLEISPVTVRRHVSDLMQKLGVADRAELSQVAERFVGGGN